VKIINILGAPGSSKSTTAAALFAKLKLAGYNAELSVEFAKKLTWDQRKRTLQDQLYIAAKQNYLLEVLREQVEVCVTDSPLLLSLIYCPANYYPSFRPLIREIFKSYENINFFLERDKPYNPKGRNQTQEEADVISCEIKDMLIFEQVPFISLKGNRDAADIIFDDVKGLI
jgi:nicotinamide riboside kinase